MTEQFAELYGRGKIIGFVTDGLDRSRHRDTPPIVLLIGPRGAGKTVLLERLDNRLSPGSPTARLDFAQAPDASPLAVMLDIVARLSSGVARVGKVKFPLLKTGLIALSLDPDSDITPAGQLDQRLNSRARTYRRTLGELGKHAGTLLPGQGQQAVVTEVATIVSWLAEGISRHQVDKYLTWYKSAVTRGNGTRVGPLLQLYDWWREKTPDARVKLWRALCTALLADLRADFDEFSLRHGQRTTNCLLLLDNVDTDAGKELLETLVECRKKSPGKTDPLLVVAAQRTPPQLHPAVKIPIMMTDDSLRYDEWREEVPKQEHPSPWYPVSLKYLNIDNVGNMVGSHVFGKGWRDTDFVHAISGGHPAATQQLASMLLQADPDFDPRKVLTLSVSDTDDDSSRAADRPLTLENYLLRKVQPEWLTDKQLNELAVFGATLRPGLEACSSVFKFLGWTDANGLEVKNLFLKLMWADITSEERLAVRPLPGLLLTRRLARDKDLWEKTHEGFLTYYRTRLPARDPVTEQCHLLALTISPQSNNLSNVAALLDSQLGKKPSRQWNATLTAITAAPNRLWAADDERDEADGWWDPGGNQRDVVKQLADLKESGDRRRTVTRLVAARWLYNDRLFDPARRLARLVAAEYFDLAALVPGDSEVFYEESDYFGKIADDWEDRQ